MVRSVPCATRPFMVLAGSALLVLVLTPARLLAQQPSPSPPGQPSSDPAQAPSYPPAPPPGYPPAPPPGYPPAPPPGYPPAPPPGYPPAPPPGYPPAPPPGYPPAPPAPGYEYPPAPYPTALAEPPGDESLRFGARGQWVLTEWADLDLINRDEGVTFSLRPSLDVFLGDLFTLGGSIGYYHTYSSDVFELLVRVGLNFKLGRHLSFWPVLENGGLLYYGRSTKEALSYLLLPLLIHPAPHFFVGIGPWGQANRRLDGGTIQTSLGFATFLGGWW
jgi:hypothetical protein